MSHDFLVKELDIKDSFVTAGGGVALIAEFGLHVMVQGQLSIRFAAFDTGKIRGGGELLDAMAEALNRRSVRLVAGEFGATLLPWRANLNIDGAMSCWRPRVIVVTRCPLLTDLGSSFLKSLCRSGL